MAVSDFGTEVSDVTALLPFDTSRINATSYLTTAMIGEWITEGASHIAAALSAAGVSPEGVDDTTEAQCRQAVAAWAAARSLERMHYDNFLRDDLDARYERTLKSFRAAPASISGAVSGNRVRSNVPTGSTDRRTFGTDYEF